MTWSSIDLAGHCRADIERTTAFEKALRCAVSSNDVVLDIGAGSGVLSILALRCGAKRVIAVESDVAASCFLRRGLEQSGCSIEVVSSDASTAELPVADLVVAELIDVWLLEEDFAHVINSLANRGIIGPTTKIIPCGYQFDIAFGTVDWQSRYPEIQWPHYEWPYYNTEQWAAMAFFSIFESKGVLSVDSAGLRSAEQHVIDIRLDFPRADLDKLALANTVRLSGVLNIWNGISVTGCGSMNAPLLIPIRTAQVKDWAQGVRVTARLSGGIHSLSIVAGKSVLLNGS